MAPIARAFVHASPLYKSHILVATISFAIFRDYILADTPNQSTTRMILIAILEFLSLMYLFAFIAFSFLCITSCGSDHETIYTLLTTGRWEVYRYRYRTRNAEVPRTLRDERDRMLFFLSNWFVMFSRAEQGYRAWIGLVVPLWGKLETFSGCCGGWSDKGSLVFWGFVGGCTVGAVLLEVVWMYFTCVPPVVAVVNQWFVIREAEEYEDALEIEKGLLRT